MSLLLKLRETMAKVTVEPALFFYFFSIFLLYSVFQPTVLNKVCLAHLSSHNISNLTCSNIHSTNSSEAKQILAVISHDTNYWIKVSSICASVPGLLMDCIMGSWSDVFGRKMPICLPSVGGFLATIIYIVMLTVEKAGVEWLCVASLISGAFGGVTSVIASSFSYVASISSQESRTIRCSVLESMIFTAGTLGPLLSAALSSSAGALTVFIVQGFFHLLNILYCIFLPDPVEEERKTEPVSIAKLFSVKHLIDSVRTVMKKRPGRNRTILLCLLMSTFIVSSTVSGWHDILGIHFYFIGQIQNFNYFYCFKNLMNALACLLLLPLAKWLGVSDYLACTIGLTSFILGLVCLGFATSTPLLFISGLFVDRVSDTALRALLSQLVPAAEVGKVFGVVAVLGDLSLIVGAILFNSIYTPLSGTHPGLAFLVGACLLLVPLVLVMVSWALSRLYRGKQEDQAEDNQGYQKDEGDLE